MTINNHTNNTTITRIKFLYTRKHSLKWNLRRHCNEVVLLYSLIAHLCSAPSAYYLGRIRR